MHRISIFVVCLSLLAGPALAGPTWTAIGLNVKTGKEAKLIAAMEKLNASEPGQMRPGTISLMRSVVDGASPATHTVIVSYDSRAQQENYLAKLFPSDEWESFQERLDDLSSPAGISRQYNLQSWGDESDDDMVWEIYAFHVTDPAAFVAALDKLMTAEATAGFPGQVHLSAVAFAGQADATHLIGVGYASEAEAEAWADPFNQTQTWQDYIAASRAAATQRGSWLLRTVKTWQANQ